MFWSKFISLPKYFYGLSSAALQCRWITCQSRKRQRSPFVERFIEDKLNFALNPCDLCVQIGRQNAGWIGVIGRKRLIRLGLSG